MAKALKTVGTAILIVGAVATGVGAIAGLALGTAVTASVAVGSFAVSASTLTAVGSLVSSVGGLLDQPKVSTPGSALGWVGDPNGPLHFAAGRIAVGGDLRHKKAYGPNDRMYFSAVTVVSDAGPIDAFESFTANDIAVTFDGSGKANSSYFANVMWRRTQLGNQPEPSYLASPSGLQGGATLPNWGPSYKLSGKAAYILTLAENSKFSAYNRQQPRPRHIIRGLKAYDWRLDGTYPGGSGPHRLDQPTTWTYTANPILWAVKWILGLWEGPDFGGAPQLDTQVGGMGVKIENIDLPAFTEAANIADTHGWTCAAWPSTDDDKAQVLDAFLQAGGAYYIQRGGKESCLHRAAPRVSVATITAADTAGAIELDTGASFTQRKNCGVPTYLSEAHGWKMTALGLVSSDQWIDEDGGRERSAPVTYSYVSNAKQAAELICLAIANTREGIRGRLPLKPYMQGIQPGSAFTITEPEFVLNGLKCLCLETDYDAATGVHTVIFVSESDGKYDFAFGQSPNPPAPPTLTPVDPTVVQPPGTGDWVVTVPGPAPDGTQFPTIDLTGYVSNENADAMLIAWRVVQEGEDPEVPPDFTDDDGVILPGWTDAGTFPPTTTQLNLTGMQPGSVIWLAIRYKRGSNVSLAQRVGPITVQTLIANPNDGSGDTTPPDVPTGLVLTSTSTINPATGQPFIKIIATWNAVTADDLDHYDVEITQGGFTITEYAGADAAPRYERVAVTGAVYSIRVRAVDKAGNASDWTASANVTGAGDTVAPSAPTGLTVGQGLTHLRLSWVNPSVNDLAKIEIYENTTNNSGTATKIDTIAAGTGYTRGGLSSGQTRYYWLKAVDTSGNTSGFSTGASGTVQSVQVTDFASTIAAPLLASNNADATTKAGGDSTGKFYLNTTDQKLYRGTGGSGWTKAVDGSDIIANSIVAGTIAAGAIGTTELAAGAVTAIKIGADQINATHIAAGEIVAEAIAAGTITGDKLSITTNLPATITVGTTGVSIGTVESRASDPAARVNANSTLIQPGRVLLTGSTALSSWLLGSDQTLLDGGKIGANTVAANKLEIGARGLGFVGLNFTSSGNTLSWSAGEVQWVDDNGTAQASAISAGSVTSASRIYVYWQKGASSLATGSYATATASNRVIVCSYFGGTNFNPIYGRTIIDGPYIRTGAITADKITTTDLAAISADLGNITAGNINMVAGSRRVRLSPGFGSGNNIILWAGPTSVGSGSETTLNGTLVLTADGSGDFFGGKTLSAPFDSGAGSTVTVPSTSYVDAAVSATIRTVNASQILTYLTGTVRMQAPADPENGASAAWRVVHTNTSGGDVVVMRSGTFLASATGSIVSQSVEALITQANANWWASVAANRTGDRIVRFQLARSGPTIFLDIQTPRLRGFYAT